MSPTNEQPYTTWCMGYVPPREQLRTIWCKGYVPPRQHNYTFWCKRYVPPREQPHTTLWKRYVPLREHLHTSWCKGYVPPKEQVSYNWKACSLQGTVKSTKSSTRYKSYNTLEENNLRRDLLSKSKRVASRQWVCHVFEIITKIIKNIFCDCLSLICNK